MSRSTPKGEMEYRVAKAEREESEGRKLIRNYFIAKGMTMTRGYYFRGLSELDIDNLKCGRITRQAMGVARDRAAAVLKNNPCHDEDMLLADELNDMLQAARKGD